MASQKIRLFLALLHCARLTAIPFIFKYCRHFRTWIGCSVWPLPITLFYSCASLTSMQNFFRSLLTCDIFRLLKVSLLCLYWAPRLHLYYGKRLPRWVIRFICKCHCKRCDTSTIGAILYLPLEKMRPVQSWPLATVSKANAVNYAQGANVL